MNPKLVFIISVSSLFFLGLKPVSADFDLLGFGTGKTIETPVATIVADKITPTLKKIPDLGAHFETIELVAGIRAMDGEVASPGEMKVLVNLDWQALPGHPEQRKALDNTAAHIINALFSAHNDLTKLRVIVRIPNKKGQYRSAAKVFSYTRACFELTTNNPHYALDTPTGAANLLALGDYVVLTAQGWMRGY